MRYVDTGLDTGETPGLSGWLRAQLPTASTLTMRTGFLGAPAVEIFEEQLNDMLARGGELLAVVGGDILQCDIRALRELLDLCHRHPQRTRVLVITDPEFQNAKTYHIVHADGAASAWVGSANFTHGGLATNLEAAITLSSDDDDPLLIERVRTATITVAADAAAVMLDASLVKQLERRVQEATLGFGRSMLGSTSRLTDHADQLLEHLDRTASTGTNEYLLPTGFTGLDRLLHGGLRSRTLTIIASRPGDGRTTLALNMLAHAGIDRDAPACLFTFESDRDEILRRILSARSSLKLADLRTSTLSDADWTRMAAELGRIHETPLYINAGHAPHLEALCAAIAAATSRLGLQLVVIDSINMVLAQSFADTRGRELAEVARRLKSLAVELDIRVVVTAELGRRSINDLRPGLANLRDSDGIAQVADVVVLLHSFLGRGYSGTADFELVVAKNRSGSCGSVPLRARYDIARLDSVNRND